MTFRGAPRFYQFADWAQTAFKHGFKVPTVRGFTRQWIIAGLVGSVLGVNVLGMASLPEKWLSLYLMVLLCPFLIMIVGRVRKLLLGIVLLELPLQLDVYLNWREEAAALNALGGLNISLTLLCLITLYILWLADLLTRATTLPRAFFHWGLPPVIYLSIVSLSAVVARDTELAFFEIFLLWQAFLLFIYIIHAIRTREDLLFAVKMLVIGLILQGVIMISLRVIGHSLEIGDISARIDDNMRVGGTVGSPNVAASYLVLLLAPSLGLLLADSGRRYKWLAVLGFGLGAVALLLTFSRGGWTGFAVSIALFCLLAWRQGWLSLKIPIAIAMLTLLIFVIFQDAIVTRLSGDDGGAAYSRIPLMQMAFRMIQDYPLLGVGSNNFAVALKPYTTPEFSQEWISTVHNKYLLVWAETGTGALIAFIWFLIATIRRGWRVWKLNDPLLSPLVLGFATGLVGHMVHMNVDLFHSRVQVQMLWLIASLLIAVNSMVEVKADNLRGSNAGNPIPEPRPELATNQARPVNLGRS